MAGSFPDPAMQSLLTAARRISNQAATADHNPSQHRPFSRPPSRSELELRSALGNSRPGSRSDLELKSALGNSRPGSRTDLLLEAKRPSSIDNLIMEEQRRRLSEAGVNRRPSAAQVLTEDTDSFIIGQRVFVDGVKPGRIQFIGDTKFGPGDWAGVFLDEPIGKNDGSVQTTRYFTCEPRHGVFSRLFRLTREPIEGAEEILNQCKRSATRSWTCQRTGGAASTEGPAAAPSIGVPSVLCGVQPLSLAVPGEHQNLSTEQVQRPETEEAASV